jgi:hypothetical protein
MTVSDTPVYCYFTTLPESCAVLLDNIAGHNRTLLHFRHIAPIDPHEPPDGTPE